METLVAFSLLLIMIIPEYTKGQALPRRPDGVSKEMYCMGCEITLKELDLILQHKPTRGMGETVTRALDRVCDLSTFKKYDVDPKKVLAVCRQIVEDEGLEAALLGDYGRYHATGRGTSYLEISKKVCGVHLNACPTSVIMGDEDDNGDGSIKYDSETEEFSVKDGHKVRRAKPVPEPNQTEGEKSVDTPKEKLVDPPREKLVDPPTIKREESLDIDSTHLHQTDGHDEL